MVNTRVVRVLIALLIAAGLAVAAREYRRRQMPSYPHVFTAEMLPSIRRAASMVPGEQPTAVHVFTFVKFRRPASSVAEGAPNDSVPAMRAIFQIRFPRGWMMVDAGHDRAFDPNNKIPSDEVFEHMQTALRGASLNVVTHEHLDHVAGIVRSPYRSELERNTLLTKEQVATLLRQEPGSLIRIDSAVAARFLVVDYDPLIPVAPGVVLVKAPGHTPGSQIIYVRLASGQEIVFAGDISNLMTAVEAGQHKPPRPDVAESRPAITRQLAWLRDISRQGIAIVLAHDDTTLTGLVQRGIIKPELDLEKR